MSTLEQRLWQRARVNLLRFEVHTERIENVLAPGTPDVHGTCRGAARSAFWIENKAVAARPKRASTPLLGSGYGHSLNREQINWHLRYAQNNGRSFVLIGIGSHEALLVPGAMVRELAVTSYEQTRSIAAARVLRVSEWLFVAKVLAGEA